MPHRFSEISTHTRYSKPRAVTSAPTTRDACLSHAERPHLHTTPPLARSQPHLRATRRHRRRRRGVPVSHVDHKRDVPL